MNLPVWLLRNRALAAILVLAAGVRGWLLWRPLAALDGRALPDDAYLAMQIARSIGSGEGPKFVDHFTNGFQPLFVWLAAIPFAWAEPYELSSPAGLDAKVKLALAISCSFDLASLLLIAAAVRRGTANSAAGLFAALIWAIHPATLASAVNGLETSIAIFFLLCVWNLMLARSFADSSPRRLFAVGLVVGVAAMARVDLLLLGLFFAVESLRALRGGTARHWLAKNLALGGGTATGFAPWAIYSWAYTSSVFPGSGRAVRWISLTHANHVLDLNFFAGMLADGLAAVHGNLPVTGIVALLSGGLTLVGATWRGRGSSVSASWLALPALFALSLFAAYTLYVFAPWFFPRYLAPINVLAISVAGAGLGFCIQHSGSKKVLTGSLAVAAIAVACVSQLKFQKLMFRPPDSQAGYRNLGLWARGAFPPGTVVGATQSGALAYYSNGYRTVNLDGVVNPNAYREVIAGRAMEYLRAEGVDYVVGWRRNYDYPRLNSHGFRESDLQLAAYMDHFRSWGIQWQVYRVGYASGRTPPPLRRRK